MTSLCALRGKNLPLTWFWVGKEQVSCAAKFISRWNSFLLAECLESSPSISAFPFAFGHSCLRLMYQKCGCCEKEDMNSILKFVRYITIKILLWSIKFPEYTSPYFVLYQHWEKFSTWSNTCFLQFGSQNRWTFSINVNKKITYIILDTEMKLNYVDLDIQMNCLI